jgi:hypothetical protein
MAGNRKAYRIYLDNRYVAEEWATSQAAAVRAYKAKEGAGNLRFYKVQAKATSSARKNPTKARVSKARKASVERRVASALAGFLKRLNPGMKTSGASIQKLKGGVLKITPIKANAGRGGFNVFVRDWYKRSGGQLVPGPGAKKYLKRGLSEDAARALALAYNRSHDPGPLSRKAEIEG